MTLTTYLKKLQMLMGHYAGYLYVNLTQDGVILENGTSTEEIPTP